MTENYIQRGETHTTFVGPDATNLYRAAMLKSAMGLYLKTGIKVNRMYTPTAMLATAGAITGKRYKRGQMADAVADLSVAIEAMRAAVPVREG